MRTRRKWVLILGIITGISVLLWQRGNVKYATTLGFTYIKENFKK